VGGWERLNWRRWLAPRPPRPARVGRSGRRKGGHGAGVGGWERLNWRRWLAPPPPRPARVGRSGRREGGRGAGMGGAMSAAALEAVVWCEQHRDQRTLRRGGMVWASVCGGRGHGQVGGEKSEVCQLTRIATHPHPHTHLLVVLLLVLGVAGRLGRLVAGWLGDLGALHWWHLLRPVGGGSRGMLPQAGACCTSSHYKHLLLLMATSTPPPQVTCEGLARTVCG